MRFIPTWVVGGGGGSGGTVPCRNRRCDFTNALWIQDPTAGLGGGEGGLVRGTRVHGVWMGFCEVCGLTKGGCAAGTRLKII